MTINARIMIIHRYTGAGRVVGKVGPRALIAAVRLTLNKHTPEDLVFDHTAQRWTIQREMTTPAAFQPAIVVAGKELPDTPELRDLVEAVTDPLKLTSWIRGRWNCPKLGGKKLTELAAAVLAAHAAPVARAA